MRKKTIFKYELIRLLRSREYLLLLIATLAYSVSLLRSMVIYGTNYTAPFSRLTFLTYCAALAPFLLVLLLVLCARQSKASELGAEAVISATPMPVHVFRLLRYGAVACAFVIAALLPLIACVAFYRLVFGYTATGALVWPGLLLLFPPALLLHGAAVLAGGKKPAVIYVLLAAVLVVGVFQIQLPLALDLTGNAVTRSLASVGADLPLAPAYIAGRLAFIAVGIGLVLASLRRRPTRRH